MLNEIKLEGRVTRITYRSKTSMRFLIAQEQEFTHDTIMIHCDDERLFDIIGENKLKVITIVGRFVPYTYKDNNRYHNGYKIICTKIE